jgi:hypothetical protein
MQEGRTYKEGRESGIQEWKNIEQEGTELAGIGGFIRV